MCDLKPPQSRFGASTPADERGGGASSFSSSLISWNVRHNRKIGAN